MHYVLQNEIKPSFERVCKHPTLKYIIFPLVIKRRFHLAASVNYSNKYWHRSRLGETLNKYEMLLLLPPDF